MPNSGHMYAKEDQYGWMRDTLLIWNQQKQFYYLVSQELPRYKPSSNKKRRQAERYDRLLLLCASQI